MRRCCFPGEHRSARPVARGRVPRPAQTAAVPGRFSSLAVSLTCGAQPSRSSFPRWPSGPLPGTTGPVKTVSASLYCGANSTHLGTSETVPLSSEGDARITSTLRLPAKCQIPALLIHPNGALGLYIATSGFVGSAASGALTTHARRRLDSDVTGCCPPRPARSSSRSPLAGQPEDDRKWALGYRPWLAQ